MTISINDIPCKYKHAFVDRLSTFVCPKPQQNFKQAYLGKFLQIPVLYCEGKNENCFDMFLEGAKGNLCVIAQYLHKLDITIVTVYMY